MSNLSFGVLLAPYRVDFYNYLHDKMDFEIYFQLHGFPGQMYKTEDVEKASTFKPKYLTIKRVFGDRRIVWGINKILKNNNPDIVLVPEFSLLTIQVILLKILFRYNFKIISQFDDSYDMLVGGENFSRLHILARKVCVPFIDDLILVDKKSTEWYHTKYHKGRWMPIIKDESKKEFYGKDLIELSKGIRVKHGLTNKLSIIFVARLIELKNLPTLLKACKLLSQPYKLIVVGDGEMRKTWEDEAKKLEVNAEFVGQINGLELDAFYHACDIFVLPSFIEAFGAVTNEALLNGCISVISMRAGSCCLIEEGKNGYTFDPSSVEDLKQKIEMAALLVTNTGKRNLMEMSFSKLIKEAFKNV